MKQLSRDKLKCAGILLSSYIPTFVLCELGYKEVGVAAFLVTSVIVLPFVIAKDREFRARWEKGE